MSIQDRTQVKTYFNNGDKPNETEFGHFIDSTAFLSGDNIGIGDWDITGDVTIAGILSATEIHSISAFTHYQDILVSELSGFNVTGTIAVTGDVIVDGIVTANNLNIDNWDSTYTTVSANSAVWDSNDASESWTQTNFVNTSGDTMTGSLSVASSQSIFFDFGGSIGGATNGVALIDNAGVRGITVSDSDRNLSNSSIQSVMQFNNIPMLRNIAGTPESQGTAISGNQIVNYDTATNLISTLAFQGTTVTVSSTPFTVTPSTVPFINADTTAAGGPITVTLPDAAAAINKVFHIKKLGTSGNVIVNAAGANTIDGQATITISGQWSSLGIFSDGTNWFIY
tara:strand:- start:263 stop:1282 length:1020 start_codon:yes stop_codon:yes gene_type:complete